MSTARLASDKILRLLFGSATIAEEKLAILSRSTAQDPDFRLDCSHLSVSYVTLHCKHPPAGIQGEVTYKLTSVGYMSNLTDSFKSYDGKSTWPPPQLLPARLVVLFWDECSTFKVSSSTLTALVLTPACPYPSSVKRCKHS
jgi:hypothetical protein